jgi:hypothetical protein
VEGSFKENAMATPPTGKEQQSGDPAQTGMEPTPAEDSLGEQLLREARDGHAEFVAGWCQFMEELGIRGKPMGAKKLRESLPQAGIDPDANEFSRGIIAMREE